MQYLHRFKLASFPFCVYIDQSKKTVIYVLIECPRFEYDKLSCKHRIRIVLIESNLGSIVEDDTALNHLTKLMGKTLHSGLSTANEIIKFCSYFNSLYFKLNDTC